VSFVVPLVLVWVSGYFLRHLAGDAGRPGFSGWLGDAPEVIGLGAAAGYLLFLCGVWLRPFDSSWLAAAPLLLGAAHVWKRTRGAGTPRALAPPDPCPWKPGEIAVAAVVALACGGGLSLLFATPLFDWDARILWALKAKMLATEGTFLTDTFRDPYRLHLHPRYPLLVPWLAALPARVTGVFQERDFQAVAGLAAALGVVQLYRLCRAASSRRGALLGALLMVLTAAWLRNLFAAGVELTLTLFLLLSVQALWRWLERGRTADLVLAAVFLFGGASVKNEGLLLSLCLIAGLGLVQLRRGATGHRDLGPVFVLAALWLLLMSGWWGHLHYIPAVSDENYLGRLRPEHLPQALHRVPLLLREIGAHACDVGTWHLTWAALLLLCLSRWRRGVRADPQSLLLALVCLLYGGGIAVIYLLSPWRDLAQHIGITFDRIFLPLLPLVILLLLRRFAASPGPAR